MTRNFAVFDVASDMAHFRRPYAITTALTFPAPPRTALCGLVGAILGLPKNECLNWLRDDQAVFGLQLLEPLKTGHVSLNLLDTKGTQTVAGIPTFRPKADNPHTIMRYEIIREPRYRVFFGHPELADRVADNLAAGLCHYTPCLGLAWMIAWFGSVKMVQAELVRDQAVRQKLVSPVRTADLQDIEWEPEAAEQGHHAEPRHVYQRIRMPAEMLPSRKVERYEEYLIDTTALPIAATLTSYWRCEDDATCFSAL